MSTSNFNNPSIIHWTSGKYWSNGQQRTLWKNNQQDPYDNSLSISQGERRKLFITGYDTAYHSGDRSRVNFRINAYNQLLRFFLKWKSGISNLSLRLRSRIDEPDPTTNRFGGYVAVLSENSIAWYKLDYAGGTYTALNPSLSTFSPALVDGEEIGIRLLLHSNLTNTQNIMTCHIARPDQFKLIGTSTDATPASHLLDTKLYNTRSYAHIKLNGTAKDVKYRYMKIWDLGDEYLLRSEKGVVIKNLISKFTILSPPVKTLTTGFHIEVP